MREIGMEQFKILCLKEYTDISKDRLRAKEAKYIKRYDHKQWFEYIHLLGSAQPEES